MYEERFGLAASPFRLNPDPKFFFGSKSHNKAMAYLHYGLRQGEGFIVITGEIGAGKSMLIGHLLDQLDRSNVVAANLLTSNLEPSALLAHILSAFRIEPSGAGKSAEIEALEDFLFDQMNRGRRVLLIVDEAQNLPVKTIEELRMLSNMDYDGTPLLQVFLVGQPEFRQLIAKPEMEQLRQRVIAAYHLSPLDAEETRDYILHRLAVAGWRDQPRIDADAFAAVHAATGGVPRRINTLCNRLFLHCALDEVATIDEAVVREVVKEMSDETRVRDADDADAPPPPAPPPLVAPRATAEIVRLFAEYREASGPARAAEESAAQRPEVPAVGAHASASPPPAPISVGMAPVSHPSPAPAAATPTVREETKPMNMFDRLKAMKAGNAASPVAPPAPPQTATLADVARAIAEASPPAPLAVDMTPADDAATNETPAPQVDGDGAALEEPEEADAPHEAPIVADAKGWRQAMLVSISETKDELKTAHAQVARLRREIGELDQRRAERRSRVVENLDKAEHILDAIRNVWR